MRIIFHIDMNAFYANCEISQHPELRGKPIVICHSNIVQYDCIGLSAYLCRFYEFQI